MIWLLIISIFACSTAIRNEDILCLVDDVKHPYYPEIEIAQFSNMSGFQFPYCGPSLIPDVVVLVSQIYLNSSTGYQFLSLGGSFHMTQTLSEGYFHNSSVAEEESYFQDVIWHCKSESSVFLRDCEKNCHPFAQNSSNSETTCNQGESSNLGDQDDYCSILEAERGLSCSENADCLCDQMVVNTLISASNEMTTDGNVLGRYIKVGLKNPSFLENGLLGNPFLEVTTADIQCHLDDDELLVSIDPPQLMHVVARKDSWTTMRNLNGSLITIKLPQEALVKSGVLIVDVFAGTLERRFELQVVGISFCRFKDCIICVDAIENFSCLPTSAKIFLIFFFVFFGIVTLALCPFLLITLQCLGKCCWWPIRICLKTRFMWNSKLGIWLRSKCAKFLDNFSPAESEEMVDLESSPRSSQDSTSSYESVTSLVQPEYRVKKPRAPRDFRNKQLFFIMILAFGFAKETMACQSGVVLTSKIRTCTSDGLKEHCDMTLSGETKVAGVGGSSCLTIKDDDDNLIGSLKITMLDISYKLVTERQYYTSFWVGEAESRHYCGGSSHCPTYDPAVKMCTEGSASDKRSAGDNLKNAGVLNYPGETFCREGCGCAACGCFLCSHACIYDAYGIVPRSPIFSVDDIVGIKESPSVKLTLTLANGTKAEGILKYSDLVQTINIAGMSLSFSITSSYSDFHSIFGDLKLLQTDKSAMFAPASSKNSPIAEKVGDIQAATISGLTHPSKDSFLISHQLASRVQESKRTLYKFRQPGVTTMSISDVLPKRIGPILWRVDSDGVVGHSTGRDIVTVSFNSLTPITIERKVDVICPEAKFINASGCHDCGAGVTIYLSAKSNCAPGLVGVTSKTSEFEVYTGTIALNRTYETFEIHGKSFLEDLEGEILLKSPSGKEASFSFDGHFPSGLDIRTDNDSDYIYHEDDDTHFEIRGDVSFWGKVVEGVEAALRGAGSWWTYLLMAVAFVIIILILYLIAPLLVSSLKGLGGSIKSVMKKRRAKKQK